MVIKDLSIDERNNYLKTGTIIMPQSYKDSVLTAKKSKDSLDLVIKLGQLYEIDKLEYSFYSIKKSVSLDELRNIILNEFSGWRLPTINELRTIMTTRPKIRDRHPNQKTNIFWSSTNNNGLFSTLDFGQNYEYQYRGDEFFEACIVRDIPDKIEYINFIGDLEIAKNDIPGTMTWDEANIACAKLGNGWRLPNRDELFNLWYKRKNIGGFTNSVYWSSEEVYTVTAFAKNFNSGSVQNFKKESRYNVRAVRDTKK
jgi:hypothetical protein